MLSLLTFLRIAFLAALAGISCAQTSYDNDFIDPRYVVAKNYTPNTQDAQSTILQWASELSKEGPWTVMNKTVTPPSGDKHDYMSWAPYSWPNCTGVGNTTALTEQQIWVTCPYVTRDGQFNPDGRLVNDVGAFQDLADAVVYNALAWVIANSTNSVYSKNAVEFIKVWFIDQNTSMNPNLNYAQMARGPKGQVGTHTGILDLKCMVKIVSGILIFRQNNNPDWTTDLDNAMNAWATTYLQWLQTADIALQEMAATNNHGSFYFNQAAALKILLNDLTGAANISSVYFNGIYMNQIDASGEQPLEASRTRPYHYRSYNLAAMITNARLWKYSDPTSDPWNKTTSKGATIKNALDFALTVNPSASSESSYASELYPNIAAVGSVYGDASGMYEGFLRKANQDFADDPDIFWNQPFALDVLPLPSSTNSVKPTTSDSKSRGSSASNAQDLVSAFSYNYMFIAVVTVFTFGFATDFCI